MGAETTIKYIKDKTGVVVPMSVLGAMLLICIGWAYRIDNRVTVVEVHVENTEENVKEIKMMVREIYQQQISE
jgi:hypothetical protein